MVSNLPGCSPLRVAVIRSLSNRGNSESDHPARLTRRRASSAGQAHGAPGRRWSEAVLSAGIAPRRRRRRTWSTRRAASGLGAEGVERLHENGDGSGSHDRSPDRAQPTGDGHDHELERQQDGERDRSNVAAGRVVAAPAARCGAARCGAVRCGAVRCGAGTMIARSAARPPADKAGLRPHWTHASPTDRASPRQI